MTFSEHPSALGSTAVASLLREQPCADPVLVGACDVLKTQGDNGNQQKLLDLIPLLAGTCQNRVLSKRRAFFLIDRVIHSTLSSLLKGLPETAKEAMAVAAQAATVADAVSTTTDYASDDAGGNIVTDFVFTAGAIVAFAIGKAAAAAVETATAEPSSVSRQRRNCRQADMLLIIHEAVKLTSPEERS